MARIHWWKLDDSGSTLTDSEGSLDLTATGTDEISGVFGGARGFDTDSHYLSASSASSVQFGSSDFTISAWFYVDDQHTGTDPRYLVYKWGGSANEYRLGLGASSACYVTFDTSTDGSSSATYLTTSPHTIDDNQWHHVAVTRTGQAYVMYIDGVAVKSTSSGPATLYTGAADFQVMQHESTSAIQTGVDNIEIFDEALSATAIKAIVYEAEAEAAAEELDRVKYLAAVNIRTGYNDALRIKAGPTWYNATIDPGEYFLSGDGSSTDLVKAIQDGMNAAVAGWEVELVEPSTVTDTPSTQAYRYLRIRNTAGSWEIDVAYASNDFHWLSVGIVSDLSEAQNDWYAMGFEPRCLWYSTQPVARQDIEYYHGVAHNPGPGVWATMQQTQDISAAYLMTHSYELINRVKFGEYQGCNNWQTFCLFAGNGCRVRYYYDVSSTYSYITGVLDLAAASAQQPARMFAGQNIYTFDVRLNIYT